MGFRDVLKQQASGLEAMSNVGVIGLHLVSGPAVGVAIGYGLDAWLGISPWGKLVFFFIGIGAGFLNVYRDTKALLRRMENRNARFGPGAQAAGAPANGGEGKDMAKDAAGD